MLLLTEMCDQTGTRQEPDYCFPIIIAQYGGICHLATIYTIKELKHYIDFDLDQQINTNIGINNTEALKCNSNVSKTFYKLK